MLAAETATTTNSAYLDHEGLIARDSPQQEEGTFSPPSTAPPTKKIQWGSLIRLLRYAQNLLPCATILARPSFKVTVSKEIYLHFVIFIVAPRQTPKATVVST